MERFNVSLIEYHVSCMLLKQDAVFKGSDCIDSDRFLSALSAL